MPPCSNRESVFTPNASPPGNQERQRCAAASHRCTAVTGLPSAATALATDVVSPRQRVKEAPATSRSSRRATSAAASMASSPSVSSSSSGTATAAPAALNR